MGFLQRLFGRADEKRLMIQAGNWRPEDYLPPTVGIFNSSGRSDAGVPVDEYVALAASAVWACVSVISDAISTLPIHVQRRDQVEKQVDHPLYRVLHDEPNEYMTSITFRQMMMLNYLLWGHCEAFIEKNETGQPIALYPLRAAVTRPIRQFGQLLYLTQVGTTITYLTPDQVFSVNYLTVDGITPISPIQQAKQSVGLSLALERYAAKLFGNGGNLGGVLTLPVGMKEDAVKNFVASWKKNYAGLDNAMKTAVLPADYKYQSTATTPENAQAIQARVHQVREIARIFRVPLHKIGDLERGTFSNIEWQSREYCSDCLLPHCTKWEQEANRKLLLEREKGDVEIKFDLDGLLRADIASRYSSYMTGRQAGFLTTNEIRVREGLPPVEGGDTLLQPLNMAPIGSPAATGGKLISAPTPPVQDDTAPAGRSLIEDAARRLLTKETKALTRAAKKFTGKPQEFRQWADGWYATHQALVARVVTTPLKAARLTVAADEYARTHCAESIRAITATIDAGAGVDDLVDEWETIRPSEIADHLTIGGK
jgi:HK97 family phage portal protein